LRLKKRQHAYKKSKISKTPRFSAHFWTVKRRGVDPEELNMDPAGILVLGITLLLVLAAVIIPQIQKRREAA
jgi:type IV secretory pathway TrbF-like protein